VSRKKIPPSKEIDPILKCLWYKPKNRKERKEMENEILRWGLAEAKLMMAIVNE